MDPHTHKMIDLINDSDYFNCFIDGIVGFRDDFHFWFHTNLIDRSNFK